MGLSTTWQLCQQGHRVALFDPRLSRPINDVFSTGRLSGNASDASLGVLMGYVFRQSSGRGWRMRYRSMKLWPQWIAQLQRFEPSLILQTSLVQIAADDNAFRRMLQLANKRRDLGLCTVPAKAVQLIWPTAQSGALQSNNDGRINPLILQRALRLALKEWAVEFIPEPVVELARCKNDWHVMCAGGRRDTYGAVVVCAALASQELLKPLGYSWPISPVLGQALALQLNDEPPNWLDWPAVLVDRGFNLIPDGPRRLLLGATVEPGDVAAKNPLAAMQTLNNGAPDWLRRAEPIKQWAGLRARPVGHSAPLLEKLETGLLLASGHYRNGVLLAPATAEWVACVLANAI
ncbi:FAD-dependent oxidoreductase [Synechococcus sp. M16CYN]|uniref:NAD(P)/FAD-dependent oxidoreductase n=1 Tax=Synechococcus sp. M16CYN TaxID=3103139 RepID=UPI00333EC779